mmetsp:Transcript_975/g.2762  ORF Transcript_975/g.2762 Transcript_975/m.2762 type:complete len:489 (-) Transcript_975:159-1625(-)
MALGVRDLLECGVCLETLENPHLIPSCGHTFCYRCIQGLQPARCPLCRQQFDQGHVRPNFTVQHLIESGARTAGVHEHTENGKAIGLLGGPVLRQQLSTSGFVANAYRSLGVPPALANLLTEEDSEIALRIYLLDNSGSMGSPDGQKLVPSADGSLRSSPCTRWEELVDMSVHHAAWNLELGVPCEFVLLNSPAPAAPVYGRDILRVDPQAGDGNAQVSATKRALCAIRPSGGTPLADRLEGIRMRLHQNSAELMQSGRKVILIIATDGLPDSRTMLVQALRRIMVELPVRVIIRLCTDEAKVVEFYNVLDRDVEMPLDILDNFHSEAMEVKRHNPWVVYTPVLHTIREAGTFTLVWDYIDERKLTPMEAAFCSQLLVQGEREAPYSRDPLEFLAAVQYDLASAPAVFDVNRRAFAPPVEIRQLKAAILPLQYAGVAGAMRTVGLGGIVDWYFETPSRDPESSSNSEEEESEPSGIGTWFCNSAHRSF